MREEMRFRVVVRDVNEKIIRDEPAPHFAAAKPIYDAIEAALGEEVTLQHGIRIMLKKTHGEPS